MALMPRLNALQGSVFDRGDLKSRAGQYRDDTDTASEDAALSDGGTAALQMTRINNMKSRAMAGNNPEWDEMSQAIRDAGGGRSVKLVGGPSPEGSNQITGLSSMRSAGANRTVQGGPYGAPDTGPYGNQLPDRGPFNSSAAEGPYGPLSLDSAGPMPESHDVWRSKMRQRIYGKV